MENWKTWYIKLKFFHFHSIEHRRRHPTCIRKNNWQYEKRKKRPRKRRREERGIGRKEWGGRG